jgi:Tetracyclin repressor-like, C-terminal domain
MGRILQDACATRGPGSSPPPGGAQDEVPPRSAGLSPVLAAQAAIVADAIAPDVPEPLIVRALIAWTQLFGMISFELFGQLVGSADPSDEFFGYAVEQMAAFIPLEP